MSKNFKPFLGVTILLIPLLSWSQVPAHTDSLSKVASDSSKMKLDSTVKPAGQTDTVKVVVDTLVKKDCYTEYYDIMRARGAKPVTDGMQQVVIALKSAESCHCFLGQVEVVGGKIKPPLYFQRESGEYKAVSTVGKKLEAAFLASMTPDELYQIKDGMSIVFRTSDNEYGRLFFYKFVNKAAQANKPAPPALDRIKE